MRPIVSAVVMLAATAVPAHAGCVDTRISALGSRLEGAPDSGSSVTYANGTTGIGYEVIEAIRDSRIGDPVRVCLRSIPKGCPAGDDRGRVYGATNLRTGAKWALPNDEHSCGGA